MIYQLLITSIVATVGGFFLAWQLQAANITQIHLESANERIAIQRANRAASERHQTQLAGAQAGAVSRAVVMRRDSDNTGAAADRLRHASQAAMRAATASLEACNAVVSAHGAVLAASTGFIQEVARDADQCHSDIQTLTDSWPN